MTSPKVSIITSTYNRSYLVGDAIRSVQAQTFTDYEMIIVDDGSPDNTHDVVTGFDDPRIRYVYQPNAGLAAGRNTAIRHSRGEYVAFLDDDDLYLPHNLQTQLAMLESRPEIGWTTGGYQVTNMEGEVGYEHQAWLEYPQLDLHTWLFHCPTCPSAVVMRRAWLERVGGFDEQLPQTEDWDLWLRLAYAGCQMACVESIVCQYRLHNLNMVHNAVKQKRGTILMLDKFFANPQLEPNLQAMQPTIYAYAYLKSASREYIANDIAEARSDMARAIELDPSAVENQSEKVYQHIIGWASNPLVSDPICYLRTAFRNLPASAGPLQKREREALAQVAMMQFFSAYQSQDWRTVRRMLAIAIPSQPSWLRNPGVWSIGAEAILGPQITGQLRKLVRRLRPGSA
jgi:glycosyltransferase involved in cell wall biosynthesis